MSAETDLYAALSGRASLTALVGTHIYPDAIPEGDTLPAVVYQRGGTEPITTLQNQTVAEQVRFGITAWSKSRITADAVADEIVTAISGASNPLADRSSGFDSEMGLHAVTVECEWWHTF